MRPSSLSSRLILSSALVSIVLLAATGVLLAGLFAAEPPSVNTPDGQRVTHRRWRDYGRSERGI